jgi:hypothetical protein
MPDEHVREGGLTDQRDTESLHPQRLHYRRRREELIAPR